jgi:transcriptional regulator with XRE-family HTH domain
MSIENPPLDSRIGSRIRQLRDEKRLTLDGLAQRTEVSRAMLSRIERGESSPTASLLNKICGGLGITLSVLFAATETSAEPLARRERQPVWRDPATGYVRRNVSPPGLPIDIVEVEFPAGGRVALDNLHLADSSQQVWLLEGKLEIGIGEQVFHLNAGDCAAMGLDQPIRFHNPTPRAVRYAVVIHHGAKRP